MLGLELRCNTCEYRSAAVWWGWRRSASGKHFSVVIYNPTSGSLVTHQLDFPPDFGAGISAGLLESIGDQIRRSYGDDAYILVGREYDAPDGITCPQCKQNSCELAVIAITK
jgi:hypothetical protein